MRGCSCSLLVRALGARARGRRWRRQRWGHGGGGEPRPAGGAARRGDRAAAPGAVAEMTPGAPRGTGRGAARGVAAGTPRGARRGATAGSAVTRTEPRDATGGRRGGARRRCRVRGGTSGRGAAAHGRRASARPRWRRRHTAGRWRSAGTRAARADDRRTRRPTGGGMTGTGGTTGTPVPRAVPERRAPRTRRERPRAAGAWHVPLAVLHFCRTRGRPTSPALRRRRVRHDYQRPDRGGGWGRSNQFLTDASIVISRTAGAADAHVHPHRRLLFARLRTTCLFPVPASGVVEGEHGTRARATATAI